MEPRCLSLPDASVLVFPDAVEAGEAAAEHLMKAAKAAIQMRGKAVLGLATGNTPLPVYAELARACQSGRFLFDDVVTYNLDEYYPISPRDPRSYRTYMHRHLFSQINLPAHQAHVPDGSVPESGVADYCALYDRWIENDGGLDFQLLGIGRNGHLAFNEPSDLPIEEFRQTPTRVAKLHPVTRSDALKEFDGNANLVPARALTMGLRPILNARSLVILAMGAKKASIVAKALQDPISSKVPASLLRLVPHQTVWMLDEAAASELD